MFGVKLKREKINLNIVCENRQMIELICTRLYNHFFCAKEHFSQIWRHIHFSNACAIQINLGTKERLKQKCAREYGLLAKGNKN